MSEKNISMRDITEALFNHIENNYQNSIETLKLIIAQYQKQENDVREYHKNKQFEYYENFESLREKQEAFYNTYLEQRRILNEKPLNYENIRELAKLRFSPANIPDIYTYLSFDRGVLHSIKITEQNKTLHNDIIDGGNIPAEIHDDISSYISVDENSDDFSIDGGDIDYDLSISE